MNWKTTVSKLNEKHYAFPKDWDTREKIAQELECSTDRVDKLLAPGLKSGEIEKQQFPVWDTRLNRKMFVWGYRLRKETDEPAPEIGVPDEVVEAVKRTAANHPGKTPGQIRDRLPKSVRPLVLTAEVKAILDNM